MTCQTSLWLSHKFLLILHDLLHANTTRLQFAPITLISLFNMWPWPNRRDSFRIDIIMTLRIVLLDVPEIRRVLILVVVPVQILEPVVQYRILPADHAEVAFEMLHVDRVEADQSCICPDVNFSHLLSEDVRAFIAMGDFFEFVQGGEDWWQVLLVDVLVGGEASCQ